MLYSPYSYQGYLFVWRLPVPYPSSAESISTVNLVLTVSKIQIYFEGQKEQTRYLVWSHIQNVEFYLVSHVKTNNLLWTDLPAAVAYFSFYFTKVQFSRPISGLHCTGLQWLSSLIRKFCNSASEAALADSLRVDILVIKVHVILPASQFLSIAYSKLLVANSQIIHIFF